MSLRVGDPPFSRREFSEEAVSGNQGATRRGVKAPYSPGCC